MSAQTTETSEPKSESIGASTKHPKKGTHKVPWRELPEEVRKQRLMNLQKLIKKENEEFIHNFLNSEDRVTETIEQLRSAIIESHKECRAELKKISSQSPDVQAVKDLFLKPGIFDKDFTEAELVHETNVMIVEYEMSVYDTKNCFGSSSRFLQKQDKPLQLIAEVHPSLKASCTKLSSTTETMASPTNPSTDDKQIPKEDRESEKVETTTPFTMQQIIKMLFENHFHAKNIENILYRDLLILYKKEQKNVDAVPEEDENTSFVPSVILQQTVLRYNFIRELQDLLDFGLKLYKLKFGRQSQGRGKAPIYLPKEHLQRKEGKTTKSKLSKMDESSKDSAIAESLSKTDDSKDSAIAESLSKTDDSKDSAIAESLSKTDDSKDSVAPRSLSKTDDSKDSAESESFSKTDSKDFA